MTKLWGGRFKKKTHPLVERFTTSVSFDKRLAKYDVAGSIAHAKMLGKCGIIPKKDSDKIVKGLRMISRDIEHGLFIMDPNAEDVHTAIQNALEKKAGAVAKKLHTGRSRNDQVVTDLKMYCKDEIDSLIKLLNGLQDSLENICNKNKGLIIPGYTHTQRAQAVLLSWHLTAFADMFERDKQRMLAAKKHCDAMPLGSGALAGTSLPIDRLYVARLLKFKRVAKNSMDAVSSRDFVLEILSALSIIGVHLSRICEDFILWSTQEFGFVDIDEIFCTGSSMMPHKKNPDVLELIRGKSHKSLGSFVEVAGTMKSLPLTYNRDMQNDKEPLFSAIDNTKQSLEVLAVLLKNVKFNKANIKQALSDELIYATDIAEYLVKKGLSFKEAHDAVGKLVNLAISKNKNISQIPLGKMKAISKVFDEKVYSLLSSKKSVSSKRKQ
jgi:argininosuccinate lyase